MDTFLSSTFRFTRNRVGVCALLALTVFSEAANAQQSRVYPPYTLTTQTTLFDNKGEVISVLPINTRYHASSGNWRSVGISAGYEMATLYRIGRGVYVSNARTGLTIKQTDHAAGCPLRSGEELRRDPRFTRVESVAGLEAYVLTQKYPRGLVVESFFAPATGGGMPIKQISSIEDGRRIVQEPISIIPGEPLAEDVAGPDYQVIDAVPIFNKELRQTIISQPDPVFPPDLEKLFGKRVAVVVIVDEAGRVIWASGSSYISLIDDAAIEAAYRATFSPTLVDGRPVKAKGIIQYELSSAAARNKI